MLKIFFVDFETVNNLSVPDDSNYNNSIIYIIGCGYIGYILDNNLDTEPFLILLGLLVGLVLSVVGIYRMVKALNS